MVRLGNVIFRVRDYLFPVVLLGLGFGTRPHIAGGSMAVDHLVDLAGFLVALGGQVVRALVIGLVYITRGGQNRRIWANSLVDGGIFAHCRNPLYIGNLLVVVGLAIVHNGWAMYAIGILLFVVAYTALVRAEEYYLRGRFGAEYEDYCRRVPRWFPRVHGLRQTVTSVPFDWLKLVRKEYGSTFAWTSAMLVLLVWEHRSPGAPPIGSTELRLVIGAWIALAIAYGTARWLKLSGRIGTS